MYDIRAISRVIASERKFKTPHLMVHVCRHDGLEARIVNLSIYISLSIHLSIGRGWEGGGGDMRLKPLGGLNLYPGIKIPFVWVAF